MRTLTAMMLYLTIADDSMILFVTSCLILWASWLIAEAEKQNQEEQEGQP